MSCARSPHAIDSTHAKNTLISRFTGRVDRFRQIAANFGLRPYRTFLVWAVWDGEERGEGNARVVKRMEILPSPAISKGVTMDPKSAGRLPSGSIKLSKISPSMTADVLMGKAYPSTGESPEADVSFWYEVMEDGRGDNPPSVGRYVLTGQPTRLAGQLDWDVTLMHSSPEPDRVRR